MDFTPKIVYNDFAVNVKLHKINEIVKNILLMFIWSGRTTLMK